MKWNALGVESYVMIILDNNFRSLLSDIYNMYTLLPIVSLLAT